MIKETLSQVRKKIENSDSINMDKKKELVDLLSVLQAEIEKLPVTDADHAESVVSFAQASTHEATRKDKRPHLYELSLEGLAESVKDFEVSRPRLTEIVNSICTALSNLGI